MNMFPHIFRFFTSSPRTVIQQASVGFEELDYSSLHSYTTKFILEADEIRKKIVAGELPVADPLGTDEPEACIYYGEGAYSRAMSLDDAINFARLLNFPCILNITQSDPVVMLNHNFNFEEWQEKDFPMMSHVNKRDFSSDNPQTSIWPL